MRKILFILFVMYMPVSVFAQKKVQCPLCKGSLKAVCFGCAGKGTVVGGYMDGTGIHFTDNKCTRCNGTGKEKCYSCRGTGFVIGGGPTPVNPVPNPTPDPTPTPNNICKTCGGSGTCASCHGTGGHYEDVGYYVGETRPAWIACPSCRGNRQCFMCYGSGKF